ncbi:MAG: 50S ribosomal protein L29 [Candidatus Jettenia sp.]|uniref:Large ribosomal subunit protein uL29 n=1 Tax=Candidatus Jettenia caeni TaxID=247490 RepID=I3IM67_9BACT|nr:50S ribosomal protein L29 [Candidatus Jettenia sp. AMX1]MBC6927692.1 50S ribosomal protein L29 [Candidatus Jettenia sp.]NUN22106.1 50S ribosomal protein L29 [Candidatus Jettenia caeni]KAA0251382.1 MAG: 50S ribosomal protein L29 [Candidatus Jettenia sp. AMX1]MCE7879358.1 50S ribosomal protein L29 [Candidatus Jettenia sp. AMX1]MDL1938307.1 50S ribosomal protein L29 [Candidatus Jettenia sp. AMX1]
MKASEIRSKSRQEILEEVDASRRELLNIKFQWQAGETRNPAQKMSVRKSIARLLTILREMDSYAHKHLGEKE